MAQEGEVTTLSAQLSLAKDMGYTDDEITQAVTMNSAKDGVFVYCVVPKYHTE